eukprot:9137_1
MEPLSSRKGKVWQIIIGASLCIAVLSEYFHYNTYTTTTGQIKDYLGKGYSDDATKNEEIGQVWFATLFVVLEIFYTIGKFSWGLITNRIKSGVIPIFVSLIIPGILLLFYSFIADYLNEIDYTVKIITTFIWIAMLGFFEASVWGAMVRLIANWYPFYWHGRWTYLLAMSNDAGDAMTRLLISFVLVFYGVDIDDIEDEDADTTDIDDNVWKVIFRFGGIMCIVMAIPFALLVRDKPTSKGLEMAQQDLSKNVYIDHDELLCEKQELQRDTFVVVDDDDQNSIPLKQLSMPLSVLSYRQSDAVIADIIYKEKKFNEIWNILSPVLKQYYFWLLCMMSFANWAVLVLTWTYQVEYFQTVTDMTLSEATRWSGLLPIFKVILMPFFGFYMDKFDVIKPKSCPSYFKIIILPITQLFMCLSFLGLLIMDMRVQNKNNDEKKIDKIWVIMLTLCIEISSLPGYWLPAGVLGIELGGQTASAVVCSFIDGSGAFGLVLFTLASGWFNFLELFMAATVLVFIGFIDAILIFIYNYKLSKSNMDEVPLIEHTQHNNSQYDSIK